MKPYNLKWRYQIDRWIDLDWIIHINSPINCGGHKIILSYQIQYQDKETELYLRSEDYKKFHNEVYIPFLEAWKNKDVINEIR